MCFNAKLQFCMTAGGMLTHSATLATNSIFEAFQHDSKLKALLHGHSYTAHAIGCSAANTALNLYTDPTCNPNFPQTATQANTEAQNEARTQAETAAGTQAGTETETKLESEAEVPSLMELWDEQIVEQLSRHDRVQKVVALGKLL